MSAIVSWISGRGEELHPLQQCKQVEGEENEVRPLEFV